ncbi:HAD family hydrolase [Hydrogenophaga sp.]|uniref:HAD family hydrolase n=1 Tax=Hydrogenophaga sp. TaxID=1904254 RepID=UPI00272757C9|nr:HAD hydrolase-like protein [Hydrogenophaga sp.]MDO9438835.1 HAD hydrolase-like protein [Hydrogenophaga sp.]
MTLELTQPRKAVVFDFDGTLVDTLPGLIAATNHVLAHAGRRAIPLDEGRTMMLGGGAPRLLERAFRATGEPLTEPDQALTRWRAYYDGCAVTGSALFPDVVPMLHELTQRGVALGICTSKPLGSTLQILNALDLRGFFGSVLGKDCTPTPKPHPGHLRAVLTELEAENENSVMVGDRNPDVEVARATGVSSVLVTHGYTSGPHEALGADAVIGGFADLVGLLDTWWARQDPSEGQGGDS